MADLIRHNCTVWVSSLELNVMVILGTPVMYAYVMHVGTYVHMCICVCVCVCVGLVCTPPHWWAQKRPYIYRMAKRALDSWN